MVPVEELTERPAGRPLPEKLYDGPRPDEETDTFIGWLTAPERSPGLTSATVRLSLTWVILATDGVPLLFSANSIQLPGRR